jgi:hypothetical protein
MNGNFYDRFWSSSGKCAKLFLFLSSFLVLYCAVVIFFFGQNFKFLAFLCMRFIAFDSRARETGVVGSGPIKQKKNYSAFSQLINKKKRKLVILGGNKNRMKRDNRTYATRLRG